MSRRKPTPANVREGSRLGQREKLRSDTGSPKPLAAWGWGWGVEFGASPPGQNGQVFPPPPHSGSGSWCGCRRRCQRPPEGRARPQTVQRLSLQLRLRLKECLRGTRSFLEGGPEWQVPVRRRLRLAIKASTPHLRLCFGGSPKTKGESLLGSAS